MFLLLYFPAFVYAFYFIAVIISSTFTLYFILIILISWYNSLSYFFQLIFPEDSLCGVCVYKIHLLLKWHDA